MSGSLIPWWTKTFTLVLCLALIASFSNGACAFACAAVPMAAGMSHPETTAPSQATMSSGMTMEANHDCCPPSSATSEASTLAPTICSGPEALAWTTVTDASVLTGGESLQTQPQPLLFGTVTELSAHRITDRRWPPGSPLASWMSPTGFTPTITQMLL